MENIIRIILKIKIWLKRLFLQLNETKTKFILIGSKKKLRRILRRRNRLSIPRVNSNYGKWSFYYAGPALYKALTSQLRNVNTEQPIDFQEETEDAFLFKSLRLSNEHDQRRIQIIN